MAERSSPGAEPSAVQQSTAPTGQAYGAPAGTDELELMLENLVKTGKLDPEIMRQLQLMASKDGAAFDRIFAKLKEWGAHEGPSSPLKMADYYRPGPGKYQLKWPPSPALPLPMPFDQLDRETQFYVLFGEWSRRELEGYQTLSAGGTTGAQAIFEECLARAEQLEVAELKARSYEGLMRVAQRLGDRQAEGKWLDAALAARENG